MPRRFPRLLVPLLALGTAATLAAWLQRAGESPLLARARALELPTRYEPPPGDPLHHHTAGFAKTLCSAVFLTGLDPADAAATVGGFTAPFEHRGAVVDTAVDRVRQRVTLTLADGTTRTAQRRGGQGCVTHLPGEDSIRFAPREVPSTLPPAERTPWPMGDLLPDAPLPADVDTAALRRAADLLFGPPEARTLAVVVTHRGRIVAERYAAGIGPRTPLESWSMTKSLVGALVGVLVEQGTYTLEQPAPIPAWQTPGDPRRAIRIGDLLRMSSGLRSRAPHDPDFDPAAGYPDHLYLYTGAPDAVAWAASRPPQWPSGAVGRYRNVDPLLAAYLVRLAAERRGEDPLAWPRRHLFDRIGMRDALIETDAHGNFLGQGYGFASARDWARLGNLYLQDGVWNGERILPAGWVADAARPAPAWVADGRPVYGGAFLWVNGDGGWPVPRSAYGFRGAGGQSTTVVPSHGLVVVRIGRSVGERAARPALRAGLATLVRAVPGAGAD